MWLKTEKGELVNLDDLRLIWAQRSLVMGEFKGFAKAPLILFRGSQEECKNYFSWLSAKLGAIEWKDQPPKFF